MMSDNPQLIFKAPDDAPPKPHQWYDNIPEGVLAVVVENGRIWHKNCPKDTHASGIMGKVSKRGADGLTKIKCYHCGKMAFIPAGSGRISLNEIEHVGDNCEKYEDVGDIKV